MQRLYGHWFDATVKRQRIDFLLILYSLLYLQKKTPFQAPKSHHLTNIPHPTQRLSWLPTPERIVLGAPIVYSKNSGVFESRWRSPYILVYKDPLLTYLLVSVPPILTLRYVLIANHAIILSEEMGGLNSLWCTCQNSTTWKGQVVSLKVAGFTNSPTA